MIGRSWPPPGLPHLLLLCLDGLTSTEVPSFNEYSNEVASVASKWIVVNGVTASFKALAKIVK
jgi:hypothetical protein